VPEKDDSSIPSFRVGQNAVVIGIEQPDNSTVSTLPVTVFKRLDGDARGIGFAEPLSQLDGPVTGIIVADKSTNKTNNDVGRGGSSRTYERDVRGMNAGCGIAGRRGCPRKYEQKDKSQYGALRNENHRSHASYDAHRQKRMPTIRKKV
jgi:hypothetical protein